MASQSSWSRYCVGRWKEGRSSHSQPNPLYPTRHGYIQWCDINKDEFKFGSAAIAIVQDMVRHRRAIETLTSLAFWIDGVSCTHRNFGQNPYLARQWVDWFVSQLQNTFPDLVVDELLSNTVHQPEAFQARTPWSGSLQQFRFSTQRIHVNAAQFADMVNAVRQGEVWSYQVFLFRLAECLMHELGHLLFTWLTNGRDTTPPRIGSSRYNQQPGDAARGEAGRWLEVRLFSGCSEYFGITNHPLGNRQPGAPYVVNEAGNEARRVESGYINEILHRQISFPFRTERHAIHPTNLSRVGRGSATPSVVSTGRSPPPRRAEEGHPIDRDSCWAVVRNPNQRVLGVRVH